MDTDSNYLAISGERLEEVVKPKMRKVWLALDKWSNRTPGEANDSPLLKMLLRRRQQREGKDQYKGDVEEAEQDQVGAVPIRAARGQRHGGQQGVPDAGRADDHVRANQERFERVLRQAVGSGERHPHRAN